MILEDHLPWYTRLLGTSPTGRDFSRLLLEFNLSSDDDHNESSLWYENDQLGVSVFVLREKLDAIQFFSPDNPHFEGSIPRPPLGLKFEMDRIEVRKHLGDPDSIRPALTNGCPGHAGIDRYHTSRCTVAVIYSVKSGRIGVLGFERLDSMH